MVQTVTQNYATSLIKGLTAKIYSLDKLNHKLHKGQLRELFVIEILEKFLTNQFGIGSGIIINQKGEQSHQLDIIIYDKRMILPFIQEKHFGLYPAESVLCTIEIRSNLRKDAIIAAEKSAKQLIDIVYNPDSSVYKNKIKLFIPTCTVLGFYGSGISELKDKEKGVKWLGANIKVLKYIGLIDKYSWIKMKKNGWVQEQTDKFNNETKRFISVLLDNIRTNAEKRYKFSFSNPSHKDWLGIYIRDQGLFDS